MGCILLKIHLLNFHKKISATAKLLFPNKYLRFYPPSFTIRQPRSSLVRKAFKDGKQVVLILFLVKNIREIKERFGDEYIYQYKRNLKNIFESVVKENLPDHIVLSLFQNSSEEFSILVKIDEEVDSLFEIENYIEDITSSINLNYLSIGNGPKFQIGYMIVEKDILFVEDAIQRAYQQAAAVADRRLQSKYNDLIYEVRKILNQKKIRLFAQPIIDVSSRQIQAYEMLTRGPIHTSFENPMYLFTVARQTNMLYELELLVLEKVFNQITEIGCKHLVFINLTPITIGNLQLVHDITKLLNKYSWLNPKQIIFEVTERESIDDIKHIFTNIRLLREKGFRFAVDDTGAGYASLHTISKIMPDIIKIDRSVIQNIDSNKVKESMLKGLLLIAKQTGSLVVAEGIETKEEAFVLLQNKVDLAQGYYYARPDDMKKIVSIQ